MDHSINIPDKASLPLLAMDEIPTPREDAEDIVALVKQSGRIVGYKLSGGRILDKPEAIELARQGGIKGVGIAKNRGNPYLKTLPDTEEGNNLDNLPSIPPQ